jgi:hypothetical protein
MSRAESPNPAPPPRSPRPAGALRAVLLVVRLAVACVFAYTSYEKMTSAQEAVDLFRRLGMGAGGRYLIGGLEGISALALLLPQSAAYGALLGLGIMCGALIAQVTVLGLAGLPLALAVAVGCATVLYLCRHDAPFIDNLWDR